MPPLHDGGALPAAAGTYAFFLSSGTSADIRVGRLGALKTFPGIYVYIGSAHGPGGLRARLRHHLQVSTSPRWHIDYLRARLSPLTVWYTLDSTLREHQWARLLGEDPKATVPLKGFGASDCRCPTHLFRFSRNPSAAAFAKKARRRIAGHGPIVALQFEGGAPLADISITC